MQAPATTKKSCHELEQDHTFTKEEIAKLVVLRSHYDPFREFCASNHEFEQLRFLKWRYDNGDIKQ